jgi:hypothetical protein
MQASYTGAGESRDQAGTYVNLIASSPKRSLVTRRSGGRGPAFDDAPARPSLKGAGSANQDNYRCTSGS